MHVACQFATGGLFKKLKCVLPHHLAILFGLGSLSWSAHLIHISNPIHNLVMAGVAPRLLPCPSDLLSTGSFELCNGSSALYTSGCSVFYNEVSGLTFSSVLKGTHLLDPETGGIYQEFVAAHHVGLGLVFVLSGLLAYLHCSNRRKTLSTSTAQPVASPLSMRLGGLAYSWNFILALNLSVSATVCILVANFTSLIPPYSFISKDYPTVHSLFSHHYWITSHINIKFTFI
jgi:photosystem I P700 chlorophyll a apoprotein A1